MLTGKRILLVISGGIAAFKALDLIRRLRAEGATVRCIMTQSACEFVTPLSVAALSAQPVYLDTFSLKDEAEMGHIRLSREADLVVVAPATANLIAWRTSESDPFKIVAKLSGASSIQANDVPSDDGSLLAAAVHGINGFNLLSAEDRFTFEFFGSGGGNLCWERRY